MPLYDARIGKQDVIVIDNIPSDAHEDVIECRFRIPYAFAKSHSNDC